MWEFKAFMQALESDLKEVEKMIKEEKDKKQKSKKQKKQMTRVELTDKFLKDVKYYNSKLDKIKAKYNKDLKELKDKGCCHWWDWKDDEDGDDDNNGININLGINKGSMTN